MIADSDCTVHVIVRLLTTVHVIVRLLTTVHVNVRLLTTVHVVVRLLTTVHVVVRLLTTGHVVRLLTVLFMSFSDFCVGAAVLTAEDLAHPLESLCLLQPSQRSRPHHRHVPLPATVSSQNICINMHEDTYYAKLINQSCKTSWGLFSDIN